MTEKQLDHVLRIWLDDGAETAPERFVWAALDDIEIVGQRRFRWLLPEGFDMPTQKFAVLAGAAAAIVVATALSVAFFRPNFGGPGLTDETGSPIPSSSAPPVAGSVTVTDSDCTLDGFAAPIEEGDLSIAAVNETDGPAAFDMFRIAAAGSFADFEEAVAEERRLAEAGEAFAGPPSWAISEAGSGEMEPGASKVMTSRLSAGTYAIVCLSAYAETEDPFRPFALVGPIEVEQEQCSTSDPACAGLLEAGTHSTNEIVTPFTYTVPENWIKEHDELGVVNLTTPLGDGMGLIGVWPDPVAGPRGDGVRTIEDHVAWLTTHASLETSVPAPVTIGGLEGQTLDIAVAGESGSVGLWYHEGDLADGFNWSISGRVKERLYFVDAGDRVVLIAIEAASLEEFEAFLQVATAVVESFDFTP